ncbi:hypothetical protein CC1G_15524 [Coprinopsis cinerea okayama7|uniref:Uncharacterized protein n=1 Tax=Coprinopsis cinerea (strain Okayama-7 / 130 / ATCC MYA-4618 / FGSC 9003) TaxID=240176 RepID=D6RNA5_COPC7|nr:hypothetical protein CC1G_15524 [Coprinopsis cinerea okayama7\|eukprot:XP_002910983.1 hypothetical protein CC1G_15524 [Coprinopsis cinerea okayama7\
MAQVACTFTRAMTFTSPDKFDIVSMDAMVSGHFRGHNDSTIQANKINLHNYLAHRTDDTYPLPPNMDSDPDRTPPGLALLDLETATNPAVDAAFQLEADYSRFDRWALQFDKGHTFPPCGNPQCSNGCSGPVDEGMWCLPCWLDHGAGFEKCKLVDEYLKQTLCEEGYLTPETAPAFLEDYWRMKSDVMLEETPSTCLAGLDGRVTHALDRASDLLSHSRDLLLNPLLHARRCSQKLAELEEVLASLRKENIRIANANLRARKRWMYMSDVVDQSITKLYAKNVEPRKALEEGRETLWRCQYMRLLLES